MVTLSTKQRSVNTKVTVECPIGFEFASGEGVSKTVECLIGGTWSQSQISTCQRKFQSKKAQNPTYFQQSTAARFHKSPMDSSTLPRTCRLAVRSSTPATRVSSSPPERMSKLYTAEN